MSCHFGYTPHHLAFVVLHLALLGCFLSASTRVPALLRGLTCVGISATVLYHVLMGAVRVSMLACEHAST